ncbi:diguanylate cyclase (GGDEF) domain-containing protein [Duganella sp. CF402]|uniref:GGDEF domain-containing protein n=1 Tax=unclassified Duganella TaxID=2636909 RepID=UPI0008BF4C93|nr:MULTISPECIES: sensor domain-containing diguanylate cyclase [unclassified Duganella]RZT09676.1 diguanylate cyclase (GGDEF)-like protein [Duganella sp. BK701]SEL47593.1 diguanylate cyclase (GGDEF) domain-containing protein [Duganella sp. CF402]
MADLSLFSNEQIAALLSALPDPAFILTRSGRYAAIFGGTDSRYYHDGSSLVGKYIADVLNDEKTAWFLAQINIALASRGLHVAEYPLGAEDVKGVGGAGPIEPIWFEGRVQPLGYQVLGEDAVLWVASNITASKKLEALLRMQSETDALTGLANRRKLMNGLTEHFELFARYKTPTSVLIFDIDHFKGINDQYGHLAGDKAISTTAEVCRHELRAADFPARLGGDEFVVLMPHTASAHAMTISERLRIKIAEGLQALGALGSGATISGGLSEMTAGDTSYEDVLKRADDALYRAKRDGRNRIIRHEAS